MEHGEKSPAQTKQYDGLFNTSPLTTKGRAIQLISMIGIPLLPSVTLIIYSIVYLHHFVGVYVNDVKLVRVLDVTTEAYEAMSVLQVRIALNTRHICSGCFDDVNLDVGIINSF